MQIFRAGEIRRRGNTSLRIFLNYISFPVTALFNLPRLHGRKYDAVFCYETSPVLMMLPAVVYAKLHRVPLTTYVLDLWPENLYSVMPVRNKALRAVAAGVSHWFYRRSERLVAMSPALDERLAAIAPRRSAPWCPNTVKTCMRRTCMTRLWKAALPGGSTWCSRATSAPRKTCRFWWNARGRLKAADRRDVHFVIVGDGMSRDALEREIAAADVADWFTFEGQHPVTDIPAYHTMADALFAALNASEDVGLTVPAKITSYLAAGRPCLVSVSGEAARVMDEAAAGLTSPAGDVHGLYENLLALADMPPERRAALGRAGRAYYETHFRREPLLRQLEDFVLSGKKM